jgi:hypothetical protein
MKGLYLYCIRLHLQPTTYNLPASLKGIDGKSKVTIIPYKNIEAVVSTVNLNEFSSKELARRAKEDLKWIIKHANRHEKVIERVMGIKKTNTAYGLGLKAVVPMKFGTIFEKPQNLENVFKKEYQRFKNLLARFDGKQEWSLKVYVKESALRAKLKKEQKVRTQIKQVKNLPRGADYFGELEVNNSLNNLMQKTINQSIKTFFKYFTATSLKSRQNKILSQDFTGHEEPMILNSAYLIDQNKVDNFIKEIKNLEKLNPEFIFEYTGPWPPYNFI